MIKNISDVQYLSSIKTSEFKKLMEDVFYKNKDRNKENRKHEIQKTKKNPTA